MSLDKFNAQNALPFAVLYVSHSRCIHNTHVIVLALIYFYTWDVRTESNELSPMGSNTF